MSISDEPSVRAEQLETPEARAETAVFRHSPGPDAKLKREWEPGCQPDEVYEQNLAPWRAWMRRKLVHRLRGEQDWMAGWQKRVRTEMRDRYFYWTAIFGNKNSELTTITSFLAHTFFMTFLPIFFFFGFPLRGRGLLHVVGLGIYVSSFAKDLVCTPRPYSPPVIRLSMSTHHHEYGFPSSHSTNSVSIALFLGECLYDIRDRIGLSNLILGWSLLAFYAVSVVGGRLYTGMHSTADIIGGSLMGIACWILWIFVGDLTEAWVNTGTWLVPAISIPVTLGLVHYHPYPIDDCPCFEDAIAVLAVILGSFLGHWMGVVYPAFVASANQVSLFSHGPVVGLVLTVERLVIGLGILFAWRLLAKTTLLRVLPSVFRLASKLSHLDLPTRRFYKSATDYQDVPKDLAFRAFPSVVDLQLGNAFDSGQSPSGSPLLTPQALRSPSHTSLGRSASPLDPIINEGLRARRTKGANKEHANGHEVRKERKGDRAKYDVEVLTKVVVYAGIGFLATTAVPSLFGLLEQAIL